MQFSKIKLIIAINQQGKIGFSDGRLPWHIPEDLAIFKTYTAGNIVVIGYNTYLSIKEKFPLGFPNRHTLVFTSKRKNLLPEGVLAISSVAEIIELKEKFPDQDIFVAGGASLYDLVLDQDICEEIIVSCIDVASDADVEVSARNNLFDYLNFIDYKKSLGVEYRLDSTRVKSWFDSSKSSVVPGEFVKIIKLS